MRDSWKILVEYLSKGTVLIVVGVLILNSTIDQSQFQESISNILTVSSIITGIVFAYLINKLFNIKAEREKRQETVELLSAKLTEFRRLCFSILHHNYFWKDHSDIHRFKDIYPLDTFNDLHDQRNEDPRITDFWLKGQGFSQTRADLYLAFEQIADVSDGKDYWVYDRTASFKYSLDQISEYYDSTNQIWYYLDYKWYKHAEGIFDDTSLQNSYETARMSELINKIDDTYKGANIDRLLIAKVASDFHGKYLADLFSLTKKNQGDLPTNLKGILWTQMIMLVFGVLTPLFLSTITLDNESKVYALKYSLLIISEGLLVYLFQLFEFSRQEIRV